MRRRTRDDDGVLSDRDPARAVHDRQLEDSELLSRACGELRQGAHGHRLVDLVVEGPHIRIGADRAEEDDDGPCVIPAQAVDDRLNVDPGPLDLWGDAFEICVQGSRQLRPGRLGPRGPQVSEGLDPTTAPFLVMPEIQVRPPADRLRGHATTDLHGSGIALTLLKVNPAVARNGIRMAPPLGFHWKRSWRSWPFGWPLDVLLVSLTADVGEISALLASAGHRILETIVQRRDHPDSRTFVGRGKLEEIQARVDAGGSAAGGFYREVPPTTHYQLERDPGGECYDRLRGLLELFAQRASSREGKLQVELALLQYEGPLRPEWIHEADVG